jgi:uncharacterized protein YcnI
MKRLLLVVVTALMSAQLASAHIRIAPTESTAGAREKYTNGRCRRVVFRSPKKT